jgi:hypothetical protein
MPPSYGHSSHELRVRRARVREIKMGKQITAGCGCEHCTLPLVPDQGRDIGAHLDEGDTMIVCDDCYRDLMGAEPYSQE